MFSLTHVATEKEEKKRNEEKKNSKYMLIINLDKILKVFPVSISED